MSKWHFVYRIVEVGSWAKRTCCYLGGERATGIGVGRIVEVYYRVRRAGCRCEGG